MRSHEFPKRFVAAGSWGVGSTVSRGGSSVVGSGSSVAISTSPSELVSGMTFGSGVGTGAGAGAKVGAGAGVGRRSSSLANHGIAVSTLGGLGLA